MTCTDPEFFATVITTPTRTVRSSCGEGSEHLDVLRDLEGLPTGEVARILGSSEATVRSQISKARVKMKDFVERYFRRRV